MWEDRAGRIDRDGHRLVWRQVADDLLASIRSGELPPGAKLPNERELAEIYGVARVTIGTAVRHLRAEGHLMVTVGRGTFVAKRE